MTDGVLGDLLPDLDQGITELLDSLNCNLVALDGLEHNVSGVDLLGLGHESVWIVNGINSFQHPPRTACILFSHEARH